MDTRTDKQPTSQADQSAAGSEVVRFTVGGETIVGTLIRARKTELRSDKGYPAVVMGHGLSMTRDSSLHLYAQRFAEAGIHVLFFDYRCFGDSTGTPRELVSVKQQVADYRAALGFIRSRDDVDARRVAVWGTSYSGGIALQAAHEDGQVTALVMQVPNLDNAATALYLARQLALKAPMQGLWLSARAVMDAGSGLLGLPPVYTKAIGRQGEWAAYTNNTSWEHTQLIRGPAWQNRIALRDFVNPKLFRPVRHAATLKCPMMIITADQDDLTPLGPMLKAAKLGGDRVELHRYDTSHFAIYNGELFEDVVSKEIDFLVRHLG